MSQKSISIEKVVDIIDKKILMVKQAAEDLDNKRGWSGLESSWYDGAISSKEDEIDMLEDLKAEILNS